MKSSNNGALTISVTDLVSFCCRSGDLKSFGEGGPTAQEGIRAHQSFQRNRKKQYKEVYQAEYAVSHVFETSGANVVLRGRIDGFINELIPTLEEIKSTFTAVEAIPPETKQEHLAQLKVYAWLFCNINNIERIKGNLVWIDLWRNQQQESTYEFTRDELDRFIQPLLISYIHWIQVVETHRTELRSACESLKFPFSQFRAGQRELSVACYQTIREQDKLIAEAPTGIGKTMSSLFPALKALGGNLVRQIVFLTAKTSGRIAALETVKQCQTSGATVKVLVLTARHKLCFCNNELAEEVPIFEPQSRSAANHSGQLQLDDVVRDKSFTSPTNQCGFQIGFYDRINNAIKDCFSRSILDQATIETVARTHQVCPFALSIQMVPWCDVIIADYNYVYDPLVQLSWFTQKNSLEQMVLIDEAHNLIDRSRSMYSAKLDMQLIERVAQTGQSLSHINRALLEQLQSVITDQKKLSSQESNYLLQQQQAKSIYQTVGHWLSLFQQNLDHGVMNSYELEHFKQLFRYKVIYETLPYHRFFVSLRELNNHSKQGAQSQITAVNLACFDASEYLYQTHQHFRAVIAFSATLHPAHFIQKTLGLSEARCIALDSPFPKDNQAVFIAKDVDTRFRHREQSIERIIDYVTALLNRRPGKYLICFGGYQFLQQVCEQVGDCLPNYKVLQQTPDMSESERQAFFSQFDEEGPLVGFVITGGVFTEGLDYKGDRLHGVVVVGTGMPQVTDYQSAIQAHYQESGDDGFALAYRYPGLFRLLQSAGRVIRSESDRGVVLLLEQRMVQPVYQHLFPRHWRPQYVSCTEQMEQCLADFWQASSAND